MRIVADSQIPAAQELLGAFGAVELMPGHLIDAQSVRHADILLVRSVTPVGRELLSDSAVRFVGSATTGTDHVDFAYLADTGVGFAHAPGSNADSVAEYVIAALLAVAADRNVEVPGLTAGIVGCGNIGRRVADRLEALGMLVLRNDPPLQRTGGHGLELYPLEELLARANILTLHVPLNRGGQDATAHLVNRQLIERLKHSAWLVNTSRGEVVECRAVRDALAEGLLGAAIIDVWEREPDIDIDFLRRCTLGTPHIAGYSVDGKVAGTIMIASALSHWMGEKTTAIPQILEPPSATVLRRPVGESSPTRWLDRVVRQMYDVRADDRSLKQLLTLPPARRPDAFWTLRSAYPERRAFDWYQLGDVSECLLKPVREGLRVQAD